MRGRLLIAAFGISLVAHALVLGTAPGPAQPGANVPPAQLDARLALVPVHIGDPAPEPSTAAAAVPRSAPKPKPPPARRSEPAPPGATVAALPPDGEAAPAEDGATPPPEVVQAADAVAHALSAPEPERDPEPEPEPASPPGPVPELLAAAQKGEPRRFNISGWPVQGSIRFRVTLGERGFEVGEARHDWSHDDKRYRMTVKVKTTGVMEMLRSLQYEQRSEGAVGAKGLVPDRFIVEQSGKSPETADFDWTAGQVTMRRKNRTRTASIQRGDQDLLSLWHQIGIVGAGGLPHELTVVSGKAATPSVLELVGNERQQLPIGKLDTLRLRARALDGKLSIDIWLARSYGMLPVRIRVTDDKGETFDQQAIELRLAPPSRTALDDADARGEADERKADTADTTVAQASAEASGMIELREEERAAALSYHRNEQP